MKKRERPIPFGAPMIRAIRASLKTQTRRIVNPQPEMVTDDRKISLWDGPAEALMQQFERIGRTCPYGQPGDRLWVREAWTTHACFDHLPPRDLTTRSIHYLADDECRTGRYRHARFMPRWASRILLEVVSVRLERLNDISESDCWAEGIEEVMHLFDGESQAHMAKRLGLCLEDAKPLYAQLWESINGAGSWDANPWVWVVEFKQLESIAQKEAA